MTQDAVVTKVLPNGMAEVVVSRGTACGSNCGNCESCVFQNEIIAASCGLSEGMSVLCSFLAFCVAVACGVVYQRRSKRKNPIKFEITQLR